MTPSKTSVNIDGKEIIFETGQIARQASGSVVVKQGETFVFASACASKEPLEDIDFLPLRVDYQEKFSSVGKSLGGFIKREGRPTEREILVSRLIDRPIRPMFPDGYTHEVQLLSYVWSCDVSHSPDILAINASSAALTLSHIPLVKPIAAVRVAMINGQFVINPSIEQQKESILDLVLAGTDSAILMIEGFCDFLTEQEVLEAIEQGHNAIKKICDCLEKWRLEVGKEKVTNTIQKINEATYSQVDTIASPLLKKAIAIQDKKEREEELSNIKKTVNETLIGDNPEESEHKQIMVDRSFKKISSMHMRQMILNEKKRCDGRALDEIRSINILQGLLPRAHGSSLFTRGETQSMAVCTLGGENMGQRYENIHQEGVHRFYLQYFFPPFSVGEVGRQGPAGRREIGHGKLAERALSAIIPEKDSFPYTMRLESNITESNGSSSMASVCGGCLAMMDAGVPISRPVSGIAMGLILENDQHIILSDILGVEDALGDMDFKITGDEKGITAFQMDIKVEGITLEIMKDALNQAKAGRVHILQKMLEVCPEPMKEMSKYAPRIETIKIPPSKIASVIGPGGKQIRAIIEQTGVEIDINDDGIVSIAASNPDSLREAKDIVESLVAEVEIGKTYRGKVKSVTAFGVFVEILPGKEGLCHISELDNTRINNIFDLFKAGEMMKVKVLDINERGQLKLSRKATFENEKKEKSNKPLTVCEPPPLVSPPKKPANQ